MSAKHEDVLIRILTSANLSGVASAQKSFLGLGVSAFALTAILIGVVAVGKAALDNYKQQDDALSDLGQAVGVYNANMGKAKPLTEKQTNEVKKATDQVAAAKKALAAYDSTYHGHAATVTGGMSQIDKMRREDIQGDIASAKTKEQRARASRRLAEFDVMHAKVVHAASGPSAASQGRRADLAAKLTQAEKTLAATRKANRPEIQKDTINMVELNKKTDAFIETNKRYIENQYDAKSAVASFVRAGLNERDALRLLGDAVDYAAIKHVSLSDAAKVLLLSEEGNAKGLRDLGITTEDVNNIQKSHLTTQKKHAALMDLIEQKTAHGRDTVSQLQGNQNALNHDWQTFTATIGPGVATVFDNAAQAADWAVNRLQDLNNALVGFGNDSHAWGQFQDWLLNLIDPGGHVRAIAAHQNQILHDSAHSSADVGHARGEKSNAKSGPIPPKKKPTKGGGGIALAEGGIVTRPTDALVGEGGPEAVVPLDGRHGVGGTTINLTIVGGVFADHGPTIDRLTIGIAQRLRMVWGI